MLNKLNSWDTELYPHDPWPEEEDKKSSQDEGWQENCNLPRGLRSKEKQPNFKEDRVTPHVEKSSQNVDWQENCNLPRGWKSKAKQPKFKEDRMTPHVERFSQDGGWQENGDLPR